ncbi:MAG TPA: fumarylacetoacetate hydrolase family protein, partial [Pyrinomonadaceae bacterium]|nr:fumarylacetoacetate hydrolase family protein [Pyrinomonadaceae bacterium]
MRICRFITTGSAKARFGLVERDVVRPLADGETIESFPEPRTGEPISVSEVMFLAPVSPSKVVCVGRNYREHAAELGNKMPDEPLLFLKAPSAIVASGASIERPPQSQQVEHEGELGVVIGRLARKLIESDDPLRYVLGYT